MRSLCFSEKPSWLLPGAAVAGAMVILGVLGACSTARKSWPDLPTVEHVAPQRYVGDWHEIARLPNRFQAKCGSNSRARYTLTAGGMQVRNSCTQPDGRTATVTGIARAEPDSGNAKWRVSFFRPFYGAYWILALDPDYRWVLVGTPDRKYLWILARTPHVPPDALQRIIGRARELGFAVEKLEYTPQAGALPGGNRMPQKT